MEHTSGGLVQILLLSKWVMCKFQPLTFGGFSKHSHGFLSPNHPASLRSCIWILVGVRTDEVSQINAKRTFLFIGFHPLVKGFFLLPGRLLLLFQKKNGPKKGYSAAKLLRSEVISRLQVVKKVAFFETRWD